MLALLAILPPAACPATPQASATPQALPPSAAIFGDWVPTALLAASLGFMFAGLAYMMGAAFGLGKITEWAKNEFFEAVLNLFLLAVVFTLVIAVGDISIALTGGDHIQAGRAYLDRAQGSVATVLTNSVGTIQEYAMLSSFSVSMFIPIPLPLLAPGAVVVYVRDGTRVALLSGLSDILSGLRPFFSVLFSAYFAVAAQFILLTFAENHMLSFFLPLGLVMRSFTFTRRLGSTVIAMALTLYFVYPLALALSNEIFMLYAFDPVLLQVVSPGSLLGGITGFLLGSILTPFAILSGQNVHAVVNVLRPAVQLFVSIMLLFILDFIITVTAFRSLAVALGGDPQVFGMSKLGL
ncbi:MAG: hypothetical protein PHF51_01070 [Candidatus ainarchaeum sp.]|nr:hypothetical protein [Candidatus ainarchaeum sp.]